MSFDKALAFTLKWEAGYANVAGDKGGETNFGISDRRDGTRDGYAVIDGVKVAVSLLTVKQAGEVYRNDYWNECACNLLAEPLDMMVFDCAVHSGPVKAMALLQMSQSNAKRYMDLREQHLRGIVARDPSQQKFLKGWLRRLDDLRKVAT